MAISVGNTHLQTSKIAKIDYNKIYLIAAVQKILKCGLGLLNISAPKQM